VRGRQCGLNGRKYHQGRTWHAAVIRQSITPVQLNIGAEASCIDLKQPIKPEDAEAIRKALLDHQVIVLRDQEITRDQHRAFASIFVRNKEEPFLTPTQQVTPIEGYPETLNVAADGIKKTAADMWHTDGSWNAFPTDVSVLRSTSIMPSVGGDTLFSSAGAAYDGLTDEMKQKIRYLKALHWSGYANKAGNYGIGDTKKMEASSREFPSMAHPVVRPHPETMRPTIFVNNTFTGAVVDMDETESKNLLTFLHQQIQKPDYRMRLRWTKHAVAVWDNRAVQHYATANYNEPRMLERITTCGNAFPIGFADLESGQTVNAA
jgi:taurine dioxygenase